MRTACSRGQLANGGGLGGAVHGKSGCGQEACYGDAAGSEGAVEWGETRLHQRIRSSSGKGSTWDAAARAHARAKRALWLRPVHAR